MLENWLLCKCLFHKKTYLRIHAHFSTVYYFDLIVAAQVARRIGLLEVMIYNWL